MIGVLLFVGVICIVLVLHFVRERSSESWRPIVPLHLENASGRAFEGRDREVASTNPPDRTEEAATTESIAAKCH